MSVRTQLACVLFLVCLGLGSGCSSIPKAAAMQPQDLSFASALPGSLRVVVSGGQQFEFRISNEQFEQALRDSLVQSGLVSRLAESGADYRLDVVLGDGHGIEGRELSVLWSLSRVDTQRTFWQKMVIARGRSHHFVGVTRQRRGLEYAARENIQQGLEALSRVDFAAAAAPQKSETSREDPNRRSSEAPN